MNPQRWRVTGACVPGVRHARLGKPSQDAFAWTEHPSGALIVALADGAGSAPEGGTGAKVAVQSALEVLTRALRSVADEAAAGSLFRDAMEEARIQVEKIATNANGTPRDYASTLLLCVAAADRIAAAQIGDGAAVYRPRGGNWEALTRPFVEEYLNETVFLQSPDYHEKLQVAFRQAPAGDIAVFSDGLQLLALKMPAGAPHAPFLDPLARFVAACENPADAEAQLAAFLTSPKVTQRADDDLSLVLAVRREI